MSHSNQLIMVNIDEDDDDVNENDDDDLCSPRQEIWGWCHHCRPGLDIQTGELSSNTWIICLFTWCLDFLDAQKLFGRPTRQQHCWDSVHGAVFRGHMQLWIHSLHQNRAPFKTKIWVHRPYRVLCSDTCNCGFKICHLKLKLGFQSIQGLNQYKVSKYQGSPSIEGLEVSIFLQLENDSRDLFVQVAALLLQFEISKNEIKIHDTFKPPKMKSKYWYFQNTEILLLTCWTATAYGCSANGSPTLSQKLFYIYKHNYGWPLGLLAFLFCKS